MAELQCRQSLEESGLVTEMDVTHMILGPWGKGNPKGQFTKKRWPIIEPWGKSAFRGPDGETMMRQVRNQRAGDKLRTWCQREPSTIHLEELDSHLKFFLRIKIKPKMRHQRPLLTEVRGQGFRVKPAHGLGAGGKGL